jgi:predicted CoA-binding protein
MTHTHRAFWNYGTYAVVGHGARAPFPRLTYGFLKSRGKRVFAVDPEALIVEGDTPYPTLAALPEKVDGVVIEVPREETKHWVEEAARAGIPRVWIHTNRDTPEALDAARRLGVEVCSGRCAVEYLATGFSVHTMHRALSRLMGSH